VKIPKGWKKIRLEKVAIIQTGIAKNQNQVEDSIGIPYLRVANVQDGYIDLSVIKSIQIQRTKVERYLLKKGDVLLTEGGDSDKLGRGAVWKGEIEKCVHQNHIFVARCNPEMITPEFLSTQTGSSYGKAYFLSCSKQSTNLASINSTQLKQFPVILPPIPEQKAIVDLLSAWDVAIEKTERLIAAKEKKLSAYRQQLFNPKRGSQRDGWKIVRFRDVLTEHCDLSTGNEEVFSVSVHKGIVNQIEHLGRSFSAKNTVNYNRVHAGDIVYTKSPTGDFPYGIVKQSKVDEDVIVSPLYGVFAPITEEIGTIIEFYFESPVNAKNFLHPIIQKGAKNTINITNITFLSAKLNLPLLQDEQKKIAVFVNVSRMEIDLLNELVQKYKEQKRGLMQKLLIGQWRVKARVKTVEESGNG
jgi:type I restriction enzyme, S subunit